MRLLYEKAYLRQLNPSDVGIEYRHPTIDDVEVLVDIINTSNQDNPLWDVYTPEEYAKLTFEHDDWKAKGYLLVELGGNPMGYGGARVIKRRLEHGQNDGWVNIWVVQNQRGKGIEHELMRRALEYLRERGVAEARFFDLVGTEWRLVVLEEFGFEDFQREYIMINRERVPPPKTPEGLEFEDFILKDATERHLADMMTISNDSFSEDPDFTRHTMESLKKWKDTTSDVVRISFAKLGAAVVGYCISKIEEEYNRVHNVRAGWIGGFGVTRRHRRKGVGRALLANGMKWLRDQGMDTLYVGVGQENMKAFDLYKSVGFEIEQEDVIYRLGL